VTAFFPFGAIVQLLSGFAYFCPHFVHFAIFLHLKQRYFPKEYAELKKLTKMVRYYEKLWKKSDSDSNFSIILTL